MAAAFDQRWADAVCSVCDPVFASADVGFVRQIQSDPADGLVQALLWEADPLRFAERYPDSRIVDSYGDEWPPYCIDYWAYLDGPARQVRISTEGWSFVDDVLDMSGDGGLDGIEIGNAMARILKVAPPASD